MSPVKSFSFKSLIPIGLLTVMSLASCEIDYAGFTQNNSSADNSPLMPADVWVSDALRQIEILNNTSSSYSIFKDLGQNLGISKLYFYEGNSLGKMSFLDDSISVDEMYFENGKLIFSLHSRISNTPYMVAYANEKPYAAAIKENENQWNATNPNDFKLDIPFINKASRLAIRSEAKEKNPDFVYRINQLTDTIIRQLAPSLREYFVMNVEQGDPIQLNLVSKSEDVFFTIGPKDGVNMERRNWKGNASETGDLLITVFSTTAKPKDYTLIAKRLINKSQLSL